MDSTTTTTTPIASTIKGSERRVAVRFVGFHMLHHAAASGYDMLAVPRDEEIITPRERYEGLNRLVLGSVAFLARSSGNTWYHRDSLETELRVMQSLLSDRNQIFHFLYGENSFRYAGAVKSLAHPRGNRIVATYRAW